ncbi:Intraflagellar transport protein 22 [Rhizophlyctis rosea]|uniref:Intraflagellar transport protein 22 n=1 Tax=Rhizophlyctis rosea TaxID=64517 RepID=A0AAD5X575_9FUNG|nr:Intraflagellar transport protein 22 [Rhizophlyctis rosea]
MATKLVIFVVGPSKSGKTAIANYLADLTVHTNDYHPTAGVRILEFERTISLEPRRPGVRPKDTTLAVELWDCSGDPRFHGCWESISESANGVLYVYGLDGKNEKDLDVFQNIFKNMKESQCAVFAHKMGSGTQKSGKVKLANKFLSKLSISTTSLDTEPETIRTDFDNFLMSVYQAYTESREREEESIVT